MKDLKRNTFIAIITLLSSLFCIELVMRTMGFKPWSPIPVQDDIVFQPFNPIYGDTTLGYCMKPGKFQITYNNEYSFRVTHNQDGYRIVRPPNESVNTFKKKRIMILGDSFTHGSGLNDNETYPWLLQSKIKGYDVYNLGISGYGVANVLVQISNYFMPDSGDICIYSYFFQHNNRYERSVLKMIYAQPQMMGAMGYLCLTDSNSVVYKPYNYNMWLFSPHSALSNFSEDKYNRWVDNKENKNSFINAKKAVAFINNYCKKRGAVFILAGIRQKDGTKKMLDFCNNHGIPCIDISVDLDNPDFNQMPYDDHPNAYSNMIFTERIHCYLTDNFIHE